MSEAHSQVATDLNPRYGTAVAPVSKALIPNHCSKYTAVQMDDM